METPQATAVAAEAGGEPQGEHKGQLVKSPQSKASSASPEPESEPEAEADSAASGWDLDKFFEQTPWLLLPEEGMSTGTKLDEAGKSYLFLNNAPVDNYLALGINDGHEMAAGGDVAFLVEFLRAQLDASGQYHVVVIADENIQRAGVPRWRSGPDWLDHGVVQQQQKGNVKKEEEEAQLVVKAEGDGGEEKGERSFPPQQQPVEPPLTSFLPRKVFFEPPPPPPPPTPQQVPKASSSRQDHISQQCLPQPQSEKHAPSAMPPPAFSNRELGLFQRFLHFKRAFSRQQDPAVEHPKFFVERESKLFKDFVTFLRHQDRLQLCQNVSAMRMDQPNAYLAQYSNHINPGANSGVGGGDDGDSGQQALFGNACAQTSITPQAVPHQVQPQMYFAPPMHATATGVAPIQGQYSGNGTTYATPLGSDPPPQPGNMHQNDPNIRNFVSY